MHHEGSPHSLVPASLCVPASASPVSVETNSSQLYNLKHQPSETDLCFLCSPFKMYREGTLWPRARQIPKLGPVNCGQGSRLLQPCLDQSRWSDEKIWPFGQKSQSQGLPIPEAADAEHINSQDPQSTSAMYYTYCNYWANSKLFYQGQNRVSRP